MQYSITALNSLQHPMLKILLLFPFYRPGNRDMMPAKPKNGGPRQQPSHSAKTQLEVTEPTCVRLSWPLTGHLRKTSSDGFGSCQTHTPQVQMGSWNCPGHSRHFHPLLLALLRFQYQEGRAGSQGWLTRMKQ